MLRRRNSRPIFSTVNCWCANRWLRLKDRTWRSLQPVRDDFDSLGRSDWSRPVNPKRPISSTRNTSQTIRCKIQSLAKSSPVNDLRLAGSRNRQSASGVSMGEGSTRHRHRRPDRIECGGYGTFSNARRSGPLGRRNCRCRPRRETQATGGPITWAASSAWSFGRMEDAKRYGNGASRRGVPEFKPFVVDPGFGHGGLL